MNMIFKKCYDAIKKGVKYIMGKVNEMIELKKEADVKKFEVIEHCVDVAVELIKDTVTGTIKIVTNHPVVLIAIGGALLVEKYLPNKED